MKPCADRSHPRLSPARRRLVKNIRHWGYGYFERLRVENGDPVWLPVPVIVSNIKYGNQGKPARMHANDGCALAPSFAELFDEMDKRKNYTLEHLEFQDGVPLYRKVKEIPV